MRTLEVLSLLSMGELWSLWGGLIDSCRSRSRHALYFVCVDLSTTAGETGRLEIAFRRAPNRWVLGDTYSWFMQAIGGSRSRVTDLRGILEEDSSLSQRWCSLSARSRRLAEWSVIEIWTETDGD
jgi:hypothetical protein